MSKKSRKEERREERGKSRRKDGREHTVIDVLGCGDLIYIHGDKVMNANNMPWVLWMGVAQQDFMPGQVVHYDVKNKTEDIYPLTKEEAATLSWEPEGDEYFFEPEEDDEW